MLPLNDSTLDEHKKQTEIEARKAARADMAARLQAQVANTPVDAPEAPAPAAPPTDAKAAPERELWDTLDVVKQSMRGLAQAGLNVASFPAEVGAKVGVPGAQSAVDVLKDQKNLVANTYGEAESTAGSVARPLAQFAGGAAILGPLGEATGASALVSGASGVVKAAVAGTATGAMAFDPHEERLSNVLADRNVGGVVTEWLKAKTDDSDLEGRLKSAVENAGVGVALHGTLHGAFHVVKAVARNERVRAFFGSSNTLTPPAAHIISAAEEVQVARAAVKDIKAAIGRAGEQSPSPGAMHHGTSADISKGLRFPSAAENTDNDVVGTYFHANPNEAAAYARGGKVHQATLDIKSAYPDSKGLGEYDALINALVKGKSPEATAAIKAVAEDARPENLRFLIHKLSGGPRGNGAVILPNAAEEVTGALKKLGYDAVERQGGEKVIIASPAQAKFGGRLEKLKAAKAEFKDLRNSAIATWERLKTTPEYTRLEPRVRARLDAMVDGREATLTRTPTPAMADELGRRSASRIVGDIRKGMSDVASATSIREGAPARLAKMHKVLEDNFNVGIMDFADGASKDVMAEAIGTIGRAIHNVSPAPSKVTGEWTANHYANVAKLLGTTDPAEIMRRGSLLASQVEDAGVLMAGLEAIAQSMAKQTVGIAKRVAEAGDYVTPEMEAELIQATRNVQGFLIPLKGIQRGSARATRSRALRTGYEAGTINMDVLDQAISSDFMSRANLQRIARKIAASEGNDAADILRGAATAGSNPKAAALRELYVNSLLSGPVTQSVNATGNTMKVLWDPVEQGVNRFWDQLANGATVHASLADAGGEVKAVYGAFVETGAAFVREMAAYLKMSPTKFGEGISAGLAGEFDPRSMAGNVIEATRTGKAQLAGGAYSAEARAYVGREGAISSQALLGDNASVYLKTAVDWFGKIVRLPTRAMTTIDEVFTNLNFFMHARREAYHLGKQEGLKGDALRSFMRDFPTNADSETLHGVYTKSIESAKRNVWQSEMGEFGKSAQKMLQAHPAAGFVVPFFSTPVNLFKYAANRHPVVTLLQANFGKNPVMRKFLFGSGAERLALMATPEGADMAGRLTTSMLFTGAMAATVNGNWITGRAPTDRDARAAWESTGRQEYSIKLGDQWISYGRLDPFGMLLGTYADFFLYGPTGVGGGRASDDDPVSHDAGWMALFSSAAHMFGSRNYLQGFTGLLAAIQDEEAKKDLPTFVSKLAGGFVPNIISQTEGKIDLFGLLDSKNPPGTIRDAREYSADNRLDLLRSVSNNLALRGGSDMAPRKWTVFGPAKRAVGIGWDLMSPIAATTARNSPFSEELSRISMSPALDDRIRSANGYVIPFGHRDRYGEIMSSIKLRGQTLVEAGEALVQDPAYKALPDATHEDQFKSKKDAMNRMFLAYQKAAFGQLASEFKDVREGFAMFQGSRKNPDAIKAILGMKQ